MPVNLQTKSLRPLYCLLLTIDRGGIEVKPNVRYKQVIKRLATDAILKDATCDFDATSTITLTEKILQPEEFQVNLQLCKKDFRF